MRILLFLLLCAATSARADGKCESKYWTVKGTLSPSVAGYDALLLALPKSKDPVRAINDYIRKDGLLLQLSTADDHLPGLSDYLIAEGASGFSVGLFFNRMYLWEGVKAFFTTIYEVASPTAKTSLRKWLVPMGAYPAAVEGFRVVYIEKLVGVCIEATYKVALRVSDEGNFEAIAGDSFAPPKPVAEAKCTAQRTFFGKSPFAACAQFEDQKTKAVRTLVWDQPVR